MTRTPPAERPLPDQERLFADVLTRLDEPIAGIAREMEARLTETDLRELSRLCEALYAPEIRS